MKLSDDRAVRYYTKIGDRLGGPYTLEGLESLVYLKKLSPDDLIGREDSDAFVAAGKSEIGATLFPKTGQRPASPHHWAAPGQPDAPVDPHRTHYQFTEAKFERTNADGNHKPVNVHAILDDIRQTEIASGFDRVAPSSRFRFSRRSRDFWLMLIAGNALILGGAIYFKNTASIVFGFAGCGLYSFGLLWSMYGVMDRY